MKRHRRHFSTKRVGDEGFYISLPRLCYRCPAGLPVVTRSNKDNVVVAFVTSSSMSDSSPIYIDGDSLSYLSVVSIFACTVKYLRVCVLVVVDCSFIR